MSNSCEQRYLPNQYEHGYVLTKDFYYDFPEAEFFRSCVQTLNDDPLIRDSCVAGDDDFVPGYNYGILYGRPAYKARRV